MFYRIGTILRINGLEGTVIGYIKYSNPQDSNKEWTEYRLSTSQGERWLSCDECYDEYSISWPANDVRGRIGPEWHSVDSGVQIVRARGGDVDVDPGEMADFVEYEDEAEDNTLSVEMWSDGTEYSKGVYIEKTDIEEIGFKQPSSISNSSAGGILKKFVIIWVAMVFISMLSGIISSMDFGSSKISKYLEKTSYYDYQTSITGNEKQQAKVYSYFLSSGSTTTDDVAYDIINGINGKTESVTQKDDTSDEEIAILTKDEYCLIYHPEGENGAIYVQVSSRKYNYTSDNAPYKSSSKDTKWYRSHYYSSGHTSDAARYKSSPSAYTMYNGSTVHNIGNGYFDSYSNSVRQSSTTNRNSSSGGISSGK